MNGFVPHVDLELLSSLAREVQTTAVEAAQSKIGPEGWLTTTGIPIDIRSLMAFSEYNVKKLHAVLVHCHRGGDQHIDCDTSKGFTHGLWIEAFVLGAQFMAEKHNWSEFRNSQFPCTDREASAGPEAKTGEADA